jgi:hypothetical protein
MQPHLFLFFFDRLGRYTVRTRFRTVALFEKNCVPQCFFWGKLSVYHFVARCYLLDITFNLCIEFLEMLDSELGLRVAASQLATISTWDTSSQILN